jgi:hypothetical protein
MKGIFMKVIIKDQITKNVTVKVDDQEERMELVAREALKAYRCEICKKIFDFQESSFVSASQPLYSGALQLGSSPFIFGGVLTDTEIPAGGKKNVKVVVCSFKCAQKIMDGEWKRIERYKAWVHEDLICAELKVLAETRIKDEKELVQEWETQFIDSDSILKKISKS